MRDLIKFEVGNVYAMRFIGDADLRPEYICTKRTEKTVTFEKFKRTESITRRIKIWDGVEVIVDGNYSMAPSIRATSITR